MLGRLLQSTDDDDADLPVAIVAEHTTVAPGYETGFLAEIEVPTLVVAAERDTFTPMELADSMARAIPNAELEVIEEASHAAPVEQPDRIADRVEEFLSSRLGIYADPV